MAEQFNREEQKALRRHGRKNMPPAEVMLWTRLRGRQLLGRKFRRQYSVGPYTADFYCPEARLAIEVDGDSHFSEEGQQHDQTRQHWIETLRIRFLRFTNTDVYQNLDGVLEAIATAISATPLCPPFERGEVEERSRL